VSYATNDSFYLFFSWEDQIIPVQSLEEEEKNRIATGYYFADVRIFI